MRACHGRTPYARRLQTYDRKASIPSKTYRRKENGMRAAVVPVYGPPEVVEIRDIDRPEPGPKQVLVRVVAAAVTSGDARIRGARFPDGFGALAAGLRLAAARRPVLGGVVSGTVAALGAKVDGFAVGDEVAGMTGTAMGTTRSMSPSPRRS